jgi:hypothetical protein
VRTPAGETLDDDAEIANSHASAGDEFRVRYRAGKAVPDTASGRIGPLLLVTLFVVASAAALVGAVASTAGRGGRAGRRPRQRAAEPGVAGPGDGPGGPGDDG